MTWLDGVSVVLPTYNEADTIVDVVDEVLEEVVAPFGGEVIVVDDRSPDGTWELVENTYRNDPRVHLILRSGQRGLASAVLDGLWASKARYAVVMDADGQHPVEDVADLVELLMAGADVAVGSRYVDGGRVEGWSWRRRLTSRVATAIATLGVPPARGVADPISGFFAVDRDVVVDDVIERADPHGYKVLLELLAQTPDAEVSEHPITFRRRQAGDSKLTLDEQLRFLEHVGGLALSARGLDELVNPPLLIRSLEFGAAFGLGLASLLIGLVLGDVDGAAGAALIATAGGLITLSLARLWRSRGSWRESQEAYAK